MYIAINSARGQKRDPYRLGALGAEPATAVSALGQLLWQEAPAGVTVAVYYADPEQKRRAIEWAARERAIGPRAARISISELAFGKAIPDSGNVGTQLTQLASVLSTAVAAVPQSPSITPLPGTGPSLIRTLALFTHGTSSWISIGGGISNSNAAKVIKRIAPALTDDVKIILYGCSSARGLSEASSWTETTTRSGGDDSLAARIRDALIEAGKARATVWGHTEVGHTTRNPSLRYFDVWRGKGAAGQSYLGEMVFGTLPDAMVREEIVETMRNFGFAIPEVQEDLFRTVAGQYIRRLRYSCYVGAVVRVRTVAGKRIKETNLTFREANLPEMAPLYPLDVADIIRRRWSDVCWTQAAREQAARQLIKDLKLKRQGQLQTTP